MPGNLLGQALRLTTAGESHGPGLVAILDGCPPGLPITEALLQTDLDRRRPGQSRLVTQRREPDRAELLSGVFEGQTTGTPIAILIRNQDARSKDYSKIAETYRPGHADFSYDQKYGRRDYRGGGRSSARETAARVAAGAIAKALLKAELGAEIVGYVKQVGEVKAELADPASITLEQVERRPDGSFNPSRCPDPAAAAKMEALIEATRREQDSVGGIAELVMRGLPAGLGEPIFDRLKAALGHAIFSIPAVTGVEFGAGFAAAELRGSAHNDPFLPGEEGVHTATNNHGGILGGISTGMPILMRAAVKPTSSLSRAQQTVNRAHEAAEIETRGRHDPCLLPRFVPVAEAMAALVLADHWLRWRAQCPEQASRARG